VPDDVDKMDDDGGRARVTDEVATGFCIVGEFPRSGLQVGEGRARGTSVHKAIIRVGSVEWIDFAEWRQAANKKACKRFFLEMGLAGGAGICTTTYNVPLYLPTCMHAVG
jgi:hypothetical protein